MNDARYFTGDKARAARVCDSVEMPLMARRTAVRAGWKCAHRFPLGHLSFVIVTLVWTGVEGLVQLSV
jgi:hypothetical protein